jgi:hypothetical protein
MIHVRFQRISAAALLRRVALGYIIVWVLSPPLAYGTIWRVLAVFAMLLWLALEALAARSMLLRPNWQILAAAGFVFYTSMVEWLVPDSATISHQFQIWIMLFFLVVGESHARGREDEARFSFWLVLLILPVWSFTTLWGIETIGSGVSRIISRSSDEARQLTEEGAGGFGFVYTTLLCLPILASLALRSGGWIDREQSRWRGRIAQLLVWGNFLLAGLLILRAGYSIAVILAVFALACVFLIQSRKPLRLLIFLCLAGIIAVLTAMATGPVLRSLQDLTAGTQYSTKIRDIRASLEDAQSTGTVADRTERYSRSIRLFAENPVVGTLRFDDVGKHSAILDRFAQYGFGIGLLFLALLVYMPLRLLRDRQVPIGLSLGFLVAACGFPLLNNVFMSWGLVLYLFSRGACVVLGLPLDRHGYRFNFSRNPEPAHA